MAISDKLTYLNITKQKIKEMISYGYPFLEGKNLLNINDNLKSSALGLTITSNEDGSFTLSGTATVGSGNITDTIAINLEAGTYTLSISEAVSYAIRIYFTTEGGSSLPIVLSAGNTSYTFTTSNKLVSYYVNLNNLTSGTTYNDMIYLQLESGSTATPFEKYINTEIFRSYPDYIFKAFLESLNNPSTLFNNLPKITGTGSNITLNDTANAPMRIELGATELTQDGTPTPSSPQDIHTISGDNTIVVSGKNLYNSQSTSNVLYTYVGSSSNKISSDNGSSSNFRTIFIKCLPNTEYYIKKFIETNSIIHIGCSHDNTAPTYGTQLYNNTRPSSGYSRVYTTDADATYLVVQMTSNNDAGQSYTIQQVLDGVEIGYGSTIPSSYEPYVSQEADIDLDTLEYCKKGNYEDRIFKNVSGDVDYSRELDEGAWYIKKNIGKVVLDGSEAWWGGPQLRIDGTTHFFGSSNATGLPFTAITTSTPTQGEYCNILVQNNPYNNVGNYFWYFINNGYRNLRIGFDNENITTKEQFLTWVATNKPIIYFPLATPTYTQITGTLAEQLENVYQLLKSYKGVTNISQVNNDLAFELDVEAVEDMEA